MTDPYQEQLDNIEEKLAVGLEQKIFTEEQAKLIREFIAYIKNCKGKIGDIWLDEILEATSDLLSCCWDEERGECSLSNYTEYSFNNYIKAAQRVKITDEALGDTLLYVGAGFLLLAAGAALAAVAAAVMTPITISVFPIMISSLVVAAVLTVGALVAGASGLALLAVGKHINKDRDNAQELKNKHVEFGERFRATFFSHPPKNSQEDLDLASSDELPDYNSNILYE